MHPEWWCIQAAPAERISSLRNSRKRHQQSLSRVSGVDLIWRKGNMGLRVEQLKSMNRGPPGSKTRILGKTVPNSFTIPRRGETL